VNERFIYNSILPNKMNLINLNLGSKNVVCAREGGANTTPLFLAAHFEKQNTKFGGGESEGGAGIHFPLTPFSARPARAVWSLPRRRRGTFRDFVQKRFALRSVIATPDE
jgi:hypothetical protein